MSHTERISPTAAGLSFTVASAVFLSGLGITTQLAFDAGAPVGTLLPGRFLVAAAIIWPIVWLIRPRRPSRGQAIAGLLLGVGYSSHAWLFSTSLTRLDAGLVDLLLFTYPALVMLGAVMLRRERWSGRRGGALVVASAGTALVLIGGLSTIDPTGAILALGAAAAYAAYTLCSASQLGRTDPFLLTALVTTGAAVTLTLGGLAQNEVTLHVEPGAFALTGAVGLVALGGMTTFVAGVGKLGASRASIVSAVQPALTPLLGFIAFGDRLGPEQVVGGALVVAAVVILETGGLTLGPLRVLSSLPRPERRALARITNAIDVPAGRYLLREGGPADALFLIERGHASVRRDDRHIAALGPGDFFGELALLHDGTRSASVIPTTDVRVRVVPRAEFARAMRTLPALAGAVRDTASQRLVEPAMSVQAA